MKPFQIIRHTTDSNGKPIVDFQGVYLNHQDACLLRDELNRLIPDGRVEKLRRACEGACQAAADCLPPSGEGELDTLYYKAKLLAIDQAAEQCSMALLETEAKP